MNDKFKNNIKDVLDNKIKNLHVDKYNYILNDMLSNPISLSKKDLSNYIITKYGYNNKYFNKKTKEQYWYLRGYTDESEIKQLITDNKKLTPFNYLFWVNKGVSEDDAKYKVNSFNPCKKEHWLNKGYSDKFAIELAKSNHTQNSKKGGYINKFKSTPELKKSSKRCVEYWLSCGMSLTEAKRKVSDYQTTFSREICIDKYGYIKGLEVFNARQKKWQDSLKSKSAYEKWEINVKKSKSSTHRDKKYLYLTKIVVDGTDYLKVGVTNDVSARTSKLKSELLHSFECDNANQLEQTILLKFRDKIPFLSKSFDGYTEVLDFSCYGETLDFIKGYLNVE